MPDHAASASFIETQFPVSRLSKESYKERSAKNSQTLTGLGKWWGRKPLVLVRAVILGLLMPASAEPRKDREIFLALLTMDDEGLWRRKNKSIPLKKVHRMLDLGERREWFMSGTDSDRPRIKKGLKRAERLRLQRIVFERMSYDEKLKYCKRPENLDGPSAEAWEQINGHLGTSANTISDLVRELGMRRFGRVPRVGDAFSGGGSVPFEAARIGCEAYGSDLNPVAALLTWAALNIVGGGKEAVSKVREAQTEVFDAVTRQVTAWRIEHNEIGWRADAYLYCTETLCLECGWRVPLAPSWVTAKKTQTVALLVADKAKKRFAIEIRSGVDPEAMAVARKAGTVLNSRLTCPNPNCGESTSMSAIRGDRRSADGRRFGLKRWKNDDLTPRPDDVFQERLYCVRWRLPALDSLLAAEQGMAPSELPDWVRLGDAVDALAAFLDRDDQQRLAALRSRDWHGEDHALDEARQALATARKAKAGKSEISFAMQTARKATEIVNGRNARLAALAQLIPTVLYRPADEADLDREARTLDLLRQRFSEWQERGCVPSRHIALGDETTRLIRERGWTHWHHLFNPRQLLFLCELFETACDVSVSRVDKAAMILGLARCVDYNSKLCRWHTRNIGDKSEQTFSNQAFNTLYNFACRGSSAMRNTFILDVSACDIAGRGEAVAHSM